MTVHLNSTSCLFNSTQTCWYIFLYLHIQIPKSKHKHSYRQLLRLKDRLENRLANLHRCLLRLLALKLNDTSPPLLSINMWSRDQVHLSLPHASVNIDVLDRNVERAFFWTSEPRVDLPSQVQNDEERTSKVSLEESGRVQVARRRAHWVKGDVELSCQTEEIHDGTDVRTVDAEGGLEWEFINAVTLVFPVKAISIRWKKGARTTNHARRNRM